MKIVALVSGGKDSIYAIHCATRDLHHELVAGIHLAPPVEDAIEESYMYQSAASAVVKTQVEVCLQVPCIVHPRTGKSVQTALLYQYPQNDATASDRDEVEDLYDALGAALRRFPDVQGVVCGAILSNYQRHRVESVCQRHGLVSIAPLWRRAPPRTLLHDALLRHLPQVVLVHTAAPPALVPQRHLQLDLHHIPWEQLHERYGLQVCGEGGEYETLVLDADVFPEHRLVLDQVQIRLDPDSDGGVGTLDILRYHTEDKEEDVAGDKNDVEAMTAPAAAVLPAIMPAPAVPSSQHLPSARPTFFPRPHVRAVSGGLYSISELMDYRPWSAEPPSVLEAAQSVFGLLQHILESIHCTAQDVLLVHVFLRDLSHFALINAQYAQFFGTILPPSRCTVGLEDQPLLMLDCLVQAGSGDYLRSVETTKNPYTRASLGNPTFSLRQVLHVQSLSYWAPVCIGPYSQANTLRGALHFVAGQIGLDPSTMQLVPEEEQLHQCFGNLAQILDALDAASLAGCLSSVLWVADAVAEWATLGDQCRALFATNAGVVPGCIEGRVLQIKSEYEDEETRLADAGPPPEPPAPPVTLVAVVPQLPMGARYEIEAVVASRLCSVDEAASARVSSDQPDPTLRAGWDTGHDFALPTTEGGTVELHAHLRRLGGGSRGTTTCAVVAARSRNLVVNPGHILQSMLRTLLHLPEFDADNMLHLRLYYIRTMVDGSYLRPLLQSALAAVLPSRLWPATTVIAVTALGLLEAPVPFADCSFAIQVLTLDPVRTEQSLWIHRAAQQ